METKNWKLEIVFNPAYKLGEFKAIEMRRMPSYSFKIKHECINQLKFKDNLFHKYFATSLTIIHYY